MSFLKRLFGQQATRTVAAPSDPFNLNNPLLYFSPQDAWTIRDALEGLNVFGGTGSGKTSGSGAAIASAFLRYGFGGLVMCAKPEERQLWERYAAETGRSQHLVVFSPNEQWRFNFLDYELRREGSGGGLTENIVNLFTAVTEIVEGKQGMESGDKFWDRAMRELLRNAVDLLSISQGTLTLDAITRLIIEAPQYLEQVQDEHWQQTSFCADCLQIAHEREKTPRQAHDLEMATRYWLQSFPTLAPRTRTSVTATFTSIADMLLHGIAWELFATETNIVPEVTYKNGLIIVLDLSIQEYHQLGRIAQGIFKYMFQQAILRRDAERYPRPVFLWADEAQNFISNFDYKYQSVARSARACTVYMTQNISNYYSVLGTGGRDQANALLGNLQTKIFHANTDQPTNQYASDIIAQEWMTVRNYNTNRSQGGSNHSSGGSESVQYKVLPGTFTTLRKGGPANQLQVEGIVFQGGRTWRATGETYMKAVFKQG